MARVKGGKVSGSIGNITHRDTKDGQVASEKVTKIKLSENSKISGYQFGKASGLSSWIRSNLEPILDGLNDGGLHGRLISELGAILGRYHDETTQSYSFVKHSFGRLAGMDFNINSRFKNSLWVLPEITLEGNVLLIKLREIINAKDLIFLENTNLCIMQIQLSMYALASGYYRSDITFEQEIPIQQEVIAAQQWRFVIPDGCLAVVGITLQFCRMIGNRITMANSKIFSPGQICNALFVPGEFTLPPQESIHSARPLWHTMRLDFPVTV